MDLNTDSGRDLGGLNLRLLGRFQLCRDGCPLHVSPSSERLLAYLGIRSGPVSRGTAAAELWPACTDVRAAANLRSAVWRLPGHDQGGLIAAEPHSLALDAAVSVDLRDLTRQVGPGSAAKGADVDVDVDVLRQDVLPEWPEEWLTGTRECLPKGKLWPRRVPVMVRFGKPFVVLQRRPTGERVSHEEAAQAIMLAIAELLPPEKRGAFSDVESLRARLAGVTSPA